MSPQADNPHWAVYEFAEADLGDPRRTKRVLELATALARPPTAHLPEACGDGAMLKAAYRFFAHDAIAPQDVLHSHSEATTAAWAECPWSWRCKIPRQSTGRLILPPKAWGRLAIRPARAYTFIARWP